LALLALIGAAEPVTDDDVIAAVNRIVAAGTNDGIFSLRDAKTGTTLALEFDSVRVVRGLADFGWFPDVIFREKGAPQKQYAIDFWLKPDGHGLKLVDARVHKDPQPDGQTWMMITRAPLLWWWLPTLERRSATSGIEAWQVMGTTHAFIAAHEKDGTFPFADANGKTVPLELAQIHQTVGRSKSDGRYFTCAEFRNLSDATASSDVDFWLDAATGSLQVGSVRLHENPRADNGKAPSQTHCHFEGSAFDVVE
jgi:hypothetical protein